MCRSHKAVRIPHAFTLALLAPSLLGFLCLSGCTQLPPHVLRVNGKAQPAPGYTWISNPEQDLNVRWSPGAVHPSAPHVLADSEEGKWKPGDGYTWVSQAEGDFQVRWNPGARSSIDSHRSTGTKEGEWLADPGYTFVKAFPGDLRTRWTPGKVHPNYPHMVSVEAEGKWLAEPGFRWDGTQAVWAPGQSHLLHPHVHAGEREGTWNPDSGYRWVSEDNDSFEVTAADEDTPLQHLGKAIVMGTYAFIAQKLSEPQQDDNLLQSLGRGVAGEVSGSLYQGAADEVGKALGR